MKNTALITGASGGIGRDLARQHAAAGGDLVIVARREDELNTVKQELKSQYGVSVICIVADLTDTDATQQVYDSVRQQGIDIEVLVNNAGFGGHGKFHERDWNQDHAMIRLNVIALSQLTHLVLQEMIARNRGKILNVASTAGFLPGPLQATYYATKAFVLSFSQAIAEEVSDTGITVTALCPGPVETGFGARANMTDVNAFKSGIATSASVAKIGYDAMQRGKLVVINELKYNILLNWVAPLLPRRWVLKLSRRAMEKS